MKVAALSICSIIISYLFNAYAYNTFNPVLIPLEAKLLQCVGVMVVIAFTSTIKDAMICDLQDVVKRQNEKLEKLSK